MSLCLFPDFTTIDFHISTFIVADVVVEQARGDICEELGWERLRRKVGHLGTVKHWKA